MIHSLDYQIGDFGKILVNYTRLMDDGQHPAW